MPLEIRLSNDSEYKAINDFFNRAHNIQRSTLRADRSFNDFRWEFIDCPNGKAIYAIALDDLEDEKQPLIVGIQCVVPARMTSSRGRRFWVGKAEDTLIDIRASFKYRDTDILRELSSVLEQECMKNGFEFLWGFNTIPATNKRLGYENPFRSTNGIFVVDPVPAFKNIAARRPTLPFGGKLKLALLTGGAYLYSLKSKLLVRTKYERSVNFGLNDNEGLLRQINDQNELFFYLQDSAYFQWRVTDNPHPIKYKSYQLFDREDNMRAQVICSIRDDVAFIDQLLFDKTLSKRAVRSFVQKIIGYLKKEGICMVRYMGFQYNKLKLNEIKMLKRVGFVFTGKGEQFTFKNLSSHAPVKPERIFLSRMYKQGVN